MSRAESADRLIAAAIVLGVSQGLGAMSVQGIARRAGVSKALVLYHYADKATLLRAVHGQLEDSGAARLSAATTRLDAGDPLDVWRDLGRAEVRLGELALLAALSQDDAIRTSSVESREGSAGRRLTAAGSFAIALLSALDLSPRVEAHLLGALLVRQLEGLVIAHPATSGPMSQRRTAALDAELDAFALALLGLGS